MNNGETSEPQRNVSRRRFLRLGTMFGLSAASVSLLQACAPAPQAAPTSAPAKAAQPTAAPAAKQAAPAVKEAVARVRFLNTQGGLGDWGAYVAQERGLFQQEGVEVELTPMGSQGAITNAVISGQADVATSSIPTVVTAALSNAPMKLCMATQMATPQGRYNNWWCALPGSGIEKPADVRGKKVHIFAPNSLAQAVTRTVLSQHGLAPGDYEEVGFTFDQAYTALKGGRVDVALMIEPFYSNSNKLSRDENNGQDLNVIYTMLDAFPQGIHLAGMMANTNFMTQNPESMRRLLRAYAAAARWGNQNQDEVKQIIAKYAGVPYENIRDMIPAEHSEDGKWLPGFLNRLQEIMIAEKTVEGLTQPLPDERLVETAYLPTA